MVAMTEHPLVQRLAKLREPAGGSQWIPRRFAPADKLDEVEYEYGIRLPEDLRAVLQVFGGGTLFGPADMPLGIDPLSGLFDLNDDPDFEKDLPGMFFFGGDGGGSLFFYDPNDTLGCGSWAIHMVRMGDMALDATRYLARDLTEAVENILSGVDLFA